MILKFEEWLINQQQREDIIGDFARIPDMQNANHKATKRKPDEHRNWADVVTSMAEPGLAAVFNEAWQEFLLAKQVAKGALD